MSEPNLVDLLSQSGLGQAAIFIGGLLGGALAGVMGYMRSNKAADAPAAAAAPQNQVFPQDARFFFDGPIGRALEFLQGIYRNSVELRNEAQRHTDDIRGDLGEVIDALNRMDDDRKMRSTRSRRRRPR